MSTIKVGDVVCGQYLTDDWVEGTIVDYNGALWFKWTDGDMRPLFAFKQVKLVSRQTSLFGDNV